MVREHVSIVGAESSALEHLHHCSTRAAVWRWDRTLSRTMEAEALIDDVGDLLSLLGLERHDARRVLQRWTEVQE
jgi:hypothetical protein